VIGKEITSVLSVHKHNQFNIYFLIVTLLSFYVVQFTFNIYIPTSVEHMFNGWAHRVGSQLKNILLIGALALC
jgi:hypothetical protein